MIPIFRDLLPEHADILSNKRAGEYLTMEDTKKMKYTWQVVRESMRLFPSIFGSFRKAIAESLTLNMKDLSSLKDGRCYIFFQISFPPCFY